MKIFFFIIFSNLLFYVVSQQCSINNCEKCENNGEECKKCKQNYILLDGKCPCYDRNCEECNNSYFGGCSKCKKGFYLETSTNACQCKIEHCEYCNDNGCDKCENGYEFQEGKCVKNSLNDIKCYDEHCSLCTNNKEGGCIQCANGYTVADGECNKNPNCQLMINNLCIFCPLGYFSYGLLCLPKCMGATCTIEGQCDNPCLTCNKNIIKETLGCRPLNFCEDEHCAMCITNKEGKCDRCDIGYHLFEGKCEKCEKSNCLKCDRDHKSCDTCQEGYYLINNECIAENEETKETSENGCSKIFDNNQSYCKECQDGYSNVNGKCIQCNKDNCKYCDTKDHCTQCLPNFALTDGGECISNTNGVENCISNGNDGCTQCENLFELINGKCVLKKMIDKCNVYDCLLCGDGECSLTCDEKEYYDSTKNQCQPCGDEHCRMCITDGCLICDDDYTLYQNKCRMIVKNPKKIKNCAVYDLLGNCISCESSCTLESSNKCYCTPRSLIIIIVSILGLLIIATVASICIYKKRKEAILYNRQIEQQRLRVESENAALESAKLKQETIDEVAKKDLEIPKCGKCKTESGYIEIDDCKCILCEVCAKEIFEDNNPIINNHKEKVIQIHMTTENGIHETTQLMETKTEANLKSEEPKPQMEEEKPPTLEEKRKDNIINEKPTTREVKDPQITNIKEEPKEKKDYHCSICNTLITKTTQISYKCEVCFDVTSKVFHFQCNCAFSTCAKCFNKIIESKKCPGCRKDIVPNIEPKLSTE